MEFIKVYNTIKSRRVSDAEIARIAKVSPNTVTKWKAGSQPAFDTAMRLCMEFDIKLDTILYEGRGLEALSAAEPKEEYNKSTDQLIKETHQMISDLTERIEIEKSFFSNIPKNAISKLKSE